MSGLVLASFAADVLPLGLVAFAAGAAVGFEHHRRRRGGGRSRSRLRRSAAR